MGNGHTWRVSTSASGMAGASLGGGDDATVLTATEDMSCGGEDGAGLMDIVDDNHDDGGK